MSSDSRRTISFTVETPEEKQYYDEVAAKKGYGKVSVMARVGLMQMLTRMKVPEYKSDALTDRDS